MAESQNSLPAFITDARYVEETEVISENSTSAESALENLLKKAKLPDSQNLLGNN